jgi:Zn-dependent protease with chaperone function
MSTRFFENQDAARRNTKRLVLLFCLAVLAIVAMLYLLAVVLTGVQQPDPYTREFAVVVRWWQPELLAQVALATLAIVLGGSFYKIAQLRGGGAVVAESLGGTLVSSDTRDPDQRRLLNVVEEMAIASGMSTPPVYLLAHEQGINAFAAGFTPGDAVIGVTRGCVEQLSRDELQGVVAHEFSHILSGDMSLNIRLMGVIHGILIIGIIGYFLLRSSMFAGRGRGGGRDNSGLAMLAGGVGLMVIGFLGTFFGNLIKASVSRQREFLADASAVQFTRNPDGLAGALKTIGGFDGGSVLESPNAPESSHFFFSQGLRGGLQMLFATHPPLDERIRRMDPNWEGGARGAVSGARLAEGMSGLAGDTAAPQPAGSGLPAAPEGSALDQVGEPSAAHLAYAAALLRDLPPAVHSAAHEPYGARAVIYALLIDRDADCRERQLEQLARFGEDGIDRETLRLVPEIESLDARFRLPLIDLALPALRALSPSQYQAFETNVGALVTADQKIDLFEWTLQRVLLAHLRPHFEHVRPPRVRHASLHRVTAQCEVVLSILAYAGGRSEEQRHAAFAQGASRLCDLKIELLSVDRCGLADLDLALQQLSRVDAASTQKLLAACAACIAADRHVTQAEGELLRAIADALGCPMPPLLPGQPLA